jgi:hypothetical protein
MAHGSATTGIGGDSDMIADRRQPPMVPPPPPQQLQRSV